LGYNALVITQTFFIRRKGAKFMVRFKENLYENRDNGKSKEEKKFTKANKAAIGSSGSILSIGSTGCILSIGSVGSILSIGSSGSILSIGSANSILSIASFASIGSMFSALSFFSMFSFLSVFKFKTAFNGHQPKLFFSSKNPLAMKLTARLTRQDRRAFINIQEKMALKFGRK
jgi:hypothetical protein